MQQTSNRETDLLAHRRSISASLSDAIRELNNILGSRLVGYILKVEDSRTLKSWIDGSSIPKNSEVTKTLRNALHIALILADHDENDTVQAWFLGINPQLDDMPPATLLRTGDIKQAREVLIAARSYVAGG